MALPIVETPRYELTLPSKDVKVQFRPFVVKEEKILLMAMESKDNNEIINATKQVLKACTFEQLDIEKLPMFDIEYLLLQLRSKSVGEVAKFKVICPDDKVTAADVELNLDDVNVQVADEHTNKIQLTDKIKLVMKYPQIMDMKGLSFGEMKQFEMVFSILKHCIWEVHDGDTVYNKVDLKLKDLEEFIDSFDVSQLEEVMKFFNTMPKVTHTVKVKNPKTQVESDVVIEGLESFLG